MNERIISPYKNPDKHVSSSKIIRKYSTNRLDIREIALEGIDLKDFHYAVDLGCGFGFMSQAVCDKLAPGASIIGIDACAENSSFFLDAVKCPGITAEFLTYHITNALPFPDASFDFIIASYSLYFFPEIIPEIARTLKPQGIFITITHCEDSFSGLYKAAKLNEEFTLIAKLVKNFSGENGEQKLKPHFKNIERIEYNNALHFKNEHLNDLIDYAIFKLPFMDSETGNKHKENMSEKIINNIIETISENGHVTIKKSDVIFRCEGPECK
jgi:SAM-dependent methyltransferase